MNRFTDLFAVGDHLAPPLNRKGTRMDASTIKANFEARRNAVEELRSLDAAAAGREMTAEERQTETRLNAAIAQFDDRISEGLRSLEAAKAADEARAQFEKLAPLTPAPAASADEARSNDEAVLRAMASGERRAAEFAPSVEEHRDLLKGGANGESNVLRTLYGAVFEGLRETSTIMAAGAQVIRTETGETITIPKVSGYSTAAIVGEAAAITESDPTLAAHITLSAFKYGFMSQVSPEMVTDSYFDIVGFLATQGGQSLGHGMGTHFVTGTGTGQPQGVLGTSGAATGVTLAVAGTITADQVIDLYHSVPRLYRAKGSFVFGDTTIAAIRKLKDSQGQYLWQPSVQLGQPDTLFGKPVETDVAVPALAATAGLKLGWFGDLSRGYIVRIASALRVERSDDFAFGNDLVTFRFLQRADGRLNDPSAIRVIKNP